MDTLNNVIKNCASICDDVFTNDADDGAGRMAFDVPSWGPNVEEFVKRFDARYTYGEGPKRLKNMYFTYLVEMRALVKAAPYLLQVC